MTVADVTGAGDSLAAGILAALLAGLPLDEAVRHGAAAAAHHRAVAARRHRKI